MIPMAKPRIICPHCGHALASGFLYQSVGRLAGSVKGDSKRRSPELARKAALARWGKVKAEEAKP
jgi:hypothetical protein